MKKRIVIICNLILILFLTTMSTNSYATFKIDLVSDKTNVEVNEEFNITVNANNTKIAACTVWLYFDNEKVECVSGGDSINVIDNRVVYTWVSETGINAHMDDLVQITFKAKQEGIAPFSIIGEFYDQNGNKLDMQYNQVDVGIGDNYLFSTQSETEKAQGEIEQEGQRNNLDKSGKENSDENVSDDNAKLEIMRLNEEGVNPDFSQDIYEYYLVVNENIKNLDVTAIPENDEAEVQISGNKNLKNGLNQIKINVTSKDKSNTEEYVINVTKTNDEKSANANLDTLAVESYTLSPEYQKTVTNYAIEVSNQTEDINILAIPENESAHVQISGNENLKIGQNQIVVTVTASNGITTKKYVIDVYRRNEAEEIQNEEKQQNIIEEANQVEKAMNTDENAQQPDEEIEKDAQNKVIMIGGIVLSIIVIGIVVIRIYATLRR